MKSAFLLAPKAQGDLVIVKPPRILVDAQLAKPDEHWVVSSAMYGLVTSPKDWSVYRDAELLKMRGKVSMSQEGVNNEVVHFGFQPMKDSNLWAIKEVENKGPASPEEWGRVLGYMIVYVDDILMVGDKKVTDVAGATIQRVWSTSNPEYSIPGGTSMRFLGIEIQRLKDGTYYLHQGSYVREVLERHGDGGKALFIKTPEEKEEINPTLVKVKEAQKITGELLWLASKTRPDVAWAVMKMSQSAVKRPLWTLEMGEAVLAYLRSTVDVGLFFPIGVPVDEDPDLARRRPREKGTIEVLVDASFSPGDGHSITGTIVLLAGCPIQWETRKQSLMALSTAEAELTALVEGLQVGRSVRSLVELLIEKVNLELYNDNRAAIVLASGSGGGWRTRHLRIRASCLAEALKVGEVTLDHRLGSALWADALTKSLPAQTLEKFCRGIHLSRDRFTQNTEQMVGVHGEGARLSKCMLAMLVGASIFPQGAAAEVCEKGDPEAKGQSSVLGDLCWMLVLAGLVCLLHMIKDLGVTLMQRIVAGKESIKVKLLEENAVLPQRGSEGAAGWDLFSTMACQLAPGERKLVSTGVALEIPRGHYGRIASRSSLASQGVDVAGGVIDADFRGEVKVILANHGDLPKSFEVGDRIAQIIIEKIAETPLTEGRELLTTSRGGGGFGSSNPAVRRVIPRGEDLHDQGALLSDRGALLHDGNGGEEWVGAQMPKNLSFEVHTSRGGETMPNFLDRLKRNELQEFSWLFSKEVLDIVSVQPVCGTPFEVVLRFPQGIVSLKIHRHGGWRKKLFDSELSVPLSDFGLASGVITIAWMDDGRLMIRSDVRKGSHGMHYLKQRWSGYSILARPSEIRSAGSGGTLGSC